MLGALISAGGALLGGFMQSRQADKQAKLQKQFAKNAIQWKVEDAQKAGVHPLYALGANTVSYSPQQVGDMGLSQAGQDIGRAIDTGLTRNERTSALTTRAAQLQLENMELQNAKLASEIALTRQAGQPPPPVATNPVIAGQGVEIQDAKQTAARVSNPAQDLAVTPDVSFIETPRGYVPVPSAQAKQALEDMPLGEWQWELRNKILPSSTESAPPKSWLPFGADTWWYDHFRGEWRPFNSRLKQVVNKRNIP